jgi:transcriptional regulator with XRE-family HTH domain
MDISVDTRTVGASAADASTPVTVSNGNEPEESAHLPAEAPTAGATDEADSIPMPKRRGRPSKIARQAAEDETAAESVVPSSRGRGGRPSMSRTMQLRTPAPAPAAPPSPSPVGRGGRVALYSIAPRGRGKRSRAEMSGAPGEGRVAGGKHFVHGEGYFEIVRQCTFDHLPPLDEDDFEALAAIIPDSVPTRAPLVPGEILSKSRARIQEKVKRLQDPHTLVGEFNTAIASRTGTLGSTQAAMSVSLAHSSVPAGSPPVSLHAVREFMKARGLTVPVVAEIIGCKERTLASWLKGSTLPSLVAHAEAIQATLNAQGNRARTQAEYANPAGSAEFIAGLVAQHLEKTTKSMELRDTPIAIADIKPTSALRQAYKSQLAEAIDAGSDVVQLKVSGQVLAVHQRSVQERGELLRQLTILLEEERQMSALPPDFASTVVPESIAMFDFWQQPVLQSGEAIRLLELVEPSLGPSTTPSADFEEALDSPASLYLQNVYGELGMQMNNQQTEFHHALRASGKRARATFHPRKAVAVECLLEVRSLIDEALRLEAGDSASQYCFIRRRSTAPIKNGVVPLLVAPAPRPAPAATTAAATAATAKRPAATARDAMWFSGDETGYLRVAATEHALVRGLEKVS